MRTKRNTILVSLMICFIVFVCAALFTKRAEGNAYAEDTPVEVEAKDFVVQIFNQDTSNNRTLLYLTYYGGEANIYNGLTRGEAWENHPDGTDPLFVIEKTDGTTENQWYGGWTETLGDINKTASVFSLPLDISLWKSATMKAGLYSGGKVKLKDDLVIRSVNDTWVAASFKSTDFTVCDSGKNENDYIYLERKGAYNLISGSWGVFADQKQTFTAKKTDGTTKSIDSNYLQLDKSIIYIKFNKDTLDDCVELTFPEGAYKLTDGNYDTYRYIESGFTFYKHSDGKWYNEKEAFTLSFMGEPTNMIKEGWADGYATIADDVLTLSFADGTDGYSPVISLKAGNTYTIKMDIKFNDGSNNGCWVYADESKTDQSWVMIFGGAFVIGDATIDSNGVIQTGGTAWSTVSVDYTPSEDISYLRFTDWNRKAFQLKNFTITEIVGTKTFTGAEVIGELPAVPEKEGCTNGHWEIDGAPIDAETIYDYGCNKTAVAVYNKIYTLSFEDKKDLIKANNFAVSAADTTYEKKTDADGSSYVDVTYKSAWIGFWFNNLTIRKGNNYRLTFDIKLTAGTACKMFAKEYDGKSQNVAFTDFGGVTVTDTYQTLTWDWTSLIDADIISIETQTAGNATYSIKNVTLTEKIADPISVVEGETLTNLPAVPEREGYVGYWEIDGVAISSATIYDYNSNKNAVAVYKEGYKLIIKDGNSTTNKAVGNKVKLSDLGIKNSDTQIVAGYKIGGKLYSEDYVLTVSGEAEIEVIRVAFKMKHGGSIRYVAPIGLRFSANLSESEYNSLKAIVGENNISFGIELQRVSDNAIVSTSGERFYIENGSIVYSGVILEIPEDYYTAEFTANAYLLINYEDKSEAIRVYSIEDDNTRSVYTVAKNAIAAGITGDALSVCEEIVNKVESTGIVEEIVDDQVVIGAFEVPANIATTAKYAKDAGIDVLFASFAGSTTEYFENASTSERVLQAIQAAGLKVYIPALEGNDGYRTFPSLGDNERAAAFMGYDAVAGYVIDEPTKYEIENIANKLEEVKKNFNNKTLYVNLFPSFWSGIETDFNGDYKAYLRFFCENVLSKLETGEKWLSVDRYPLVYDADGNKCLDDGWLSDIQDVVEVAKEYNAKTNIFIQTTPFGEKTAGGHDRVPAVEDIRLQAMSLMAFGVDGIGLFSYATTIENDEFSEMQTGMIDRNGNRTAIYYSVKTAISELKNFEKVIKGYDYQGIFTTDAGKTMKNSDVLASTSNFSFQNIGRTALSDVGGVNKVSSTQDTLYGYLKDAKGNLALTVVNYNDTSKNLTDTVTIAFDTSKYNAVIYYERGIRKFASLNASGEVVLNIGVGEGIFVVPCMAK